MGRGVRPVQSRQAAWAEPPKKQPSFKTLRTKSGTAVAPFDDKHSTSTVARRFRLRYERFWLILSLLPVIITRLVGRHFPSLGSSNTTGVSSRVSQRGGIARSRRRRSRYSRVLDAFLALQERVGVGAVVGIEMVHQLYILFSVPYRVGFLYDPYDGAIAKSDAWWLSLYFLAACDVLAYGIAIGSLVHSLADRRKLAQVKPRTIDVFSTMRHATNAQAAIVKFSMTRQESLRRKSTFISKEASMKPEFLLSASWDSGREIRQIHIVLQLLALIPLQLGSIGSPNLLHVLCIPMLLRVEKAPRIARAVKRSLAENERLRGVHNAGMSLLVLCVALNFIAMHWYACIFMFVNHIECGYESNACDVGTSWAARNNIVGPQLLHTYAYSLVVAGYGFLIPETNFERVFVIVIQVGRYIAFVGVVSAFVFLFECQNSRRNHFSDEVDDIKEFLVDKRVSAEIKAKVLDFYEHFWTAQRGIQEDTITASLPSHIQTTFLNHLRARLLKAVPILRVQPVHIINRLVFEMRRQSYSPRDWVLHDERCAHLYLMGRGRIAIMHAKSDDVHSYILDGQYFGLSMLVPDSTVTVRARAETYCDVYTLTRQDIYDVCLRWDAKQITFDAMVGGVREYLVTSQRSSTAHVATKKFQAADAWFMPTSRFRKYWEWGIMVALLFFALDIPYRLCFARVDDMSYPLFAVRTTLDLFLFSDVILQSRYFAFVQDERVVTDRRSIFLYYKEHGMVLDYISNVPFAIVVDCLPLSFKHANAEAVLVLHMCEWIRFLRMRHLLPTINRVLKKLQVNDTTFVIVYLFCCLPIVCHISSCLWYLLASWNSDSMLPHTAFNAKEFTRIQCLEMARTFNNCTWLLHDNVEFDVSSDYVRAFYWSVVSLVTVQFGSIFPFTVIECIYMFAWIFVGSILNYGAIGALVNAVTRMNAATEAKDEHLKLVHRFMHAEGVSRQVHRDVSSYFKHRWTSSTEQKILTALEPLPDNLRQAIQSYLHAKAVSSIQLLQDIDKSELKHIYEIMAHRSYKKDEVLVRAGDVGDELYIITRGAVELTMPINGVPTPVMVIHEGACIGEAQFLARTPYPLTATVVSASIDVSVLHKLDFDDISERLEGSMEDIEAQSILVIKKELAWLASIRSNLDRRKIRHAMHRANSTGLFSDRSTRSMYLDPGMNAYRVWECVMLVAVLYNFISIAYRIAFLMSPKPAIMYIFSVVDYATDVIFVLDMYIKLNHLTFSDRYGDQVTDVSRIRWHYLQSRSFKLDVLGSLPLYYVGDYDVMTLCRLPRLVRCMDLRTLWGDISHYIHEHVSADRIAEYLELFKLLIVLILGSHIAGAGLYFVSTTEVEAAIAHGHEPHHIWYLHDKVVHHHHHEVDVLYLRAFYWGLGVLSSMDYMDIEVTLLAETLWFCAVAIVGVLFLGIVIGQTSTAIYNASKDTRELEFHIERFTMYARCKKLPHLLLERGKLFLRFQHDCSKGIDVHEVFGDLPHHLRLDLFKDLYTSWVRNVPYFTGLQPAQIYAIAAKLRQELYLPGDDMVLEGDVATHFFIMKRGRAEKYLKAHMLVVAPVDEGVVFGEDAFFLDMRYSYSIRAVKCSEVLCLPLSEWEGMWSPETRVEVEWRIKKDVQADVTAMKRAIVAITRNLGVGPGGKPAPVKIKALILRDKPTQSTVAWHTAINFARQQVSIASTEIRPSVMGAHTGDALVNLVRLHNAHQQQQMTTLSPKKSSFTKRTFGTMLGAKRGRNDEAGMAASQLPLETLTIWHRDPPPPPYWIPHSRFREIWDLGCLAATLYFACALPFRACFVLEWSPLAIGWFGTEYLLDGLCLVDIVLRFHYYYEFKDGELQVSQALVRRRYWRHGGLTMDLFAVLPLELLALLMPVDGHARWQVASLLRLNKMVRIVHYPALTATLQRFLGRFPSTRHHNVLVKFTCSFLLPLFLVAHWMACVWFFAAFNLLTETKSPSWLVATGYVNGTTKSPLCPTSIIPLSLSNHVRFTSLNVYLVALYYATSSLTSQSFGDVVSTNAAETSLTVVFIVVSITVLGLFTGVLSGLMEEHLAMRMKFEQKMIDISTFFNYRRLPFEFFIQTTRAFRSLWQRSQGQTEFEILSTLSPKIKEDIAMHVKRSMVLSLSFVATAHEVFVRSLVTALETEQFVYADLIYQVGDVGRVLYFINIGGATVLAAKKTPLEKFQGSLFGGRSLFEDRGREYTAIADSDCECFLLYFDDFELLMERFPEYFDQCRNEWMYTERELDEEAEREEQELAEHSDVPVARRESTQSGKGNNGRRDNRKGHGRRNSVERRGSTTSHSSAAFSTMGE